MKALSLVIAVSWLGASIAVPAAEQTPPKKVAPKPPEPAKPATAPTERVELDTTQITGNRELPRVLYVVPWKRADLGELAGKPTRSLLDEVLAPVDRDVFQRQNRYHDALRPDTVETGKTDPGNRPKGE